MRTSLKSLAPSIESAGGVHTQLIAGVVESLRFQKTQGGRMMVVNLSDGTATQEVTVYNEVFDQYRELFKEDALVVIEAKVRNVRRSVGEEGESVFMRITAERIYDLAGARSRFARARAAVDERRGLEGRGGGLGETAGACSSPIATGRARSRCATGTARRASRCSWGRTGG